MKNVRTILFVDNDPVVVTMYRGRLQREGYHIESAPDGLAALKVLSTLTPDLVVLDLMLPKFNGAEVLKYIRADARLKNIPVIVLSNAYMTDLAQDPALTGANKHLLKSDCTPATLLQIIQELPDVAPAGDGAPPPLRMDGGTSIKMQSVSDDQPGAVAAGAAVPPASDISLEKERAGFLKEASAEIAKIREHCLAYLKAPSSAAKLQHLPKLYQSVHYLSTNASKAGCTHIALLTKAFDALLSEIMVKPSCMTPSMPQTIAEAADYLNLLLKSDRVGVTELTPKAKVLVVDDDAICIHVIVTTLKRFNLEVVSVQDPNAALRMLQHNQYDLVMLDINMPNMTGFQVCEKLRRLPHCKSTPVIFVTAYSSFQNRAQGVLSGGDHLITKPVYPSELALKVTILLLKAQMQRAAAPQSETKPAAAAVPEEVIQPAASIQSKPPGNGEAENIVPSRVPPPRVPPPRVPPPAPEPPPADVPEEVLQPVVSSRSKPPKKTEAKRTVPPSVSPPAPEPPAADVPEEVLQPVASIRSRPPGNDEAKRIVPPSMAPPAPEPNEVSLLEESLQPLTAILAQQLGNDVAKAVVPPKTAPPAPEPRLDEASEDVLPSKKAPIKARRPGNGEVEDFVPCAVPQSRVTPPAPEPPPTDVMEDVPEPSLSETLAGAGATRGNTWTDDSNGESFMKTEQNEVFDKLVIAVARIIFGDGNLTELNIRLVRIALERYRIHEMVNSTVDA